MATETTTTTKKNDKADDKSKPAGAPGAPSEKDTKTMSNKQQDVAGKAPPTREEILALHRNKAAGKELRTSDVVGFWDTDGDFPITGVPELDVVAIDSTLDERKSSLLMKWKVTVPTEVTDKDKTVSICKAGDLVGVWYKPGMRDMRNCGGIEVTMARDAKRDVPMKKKGMNAMKGYAIYADGVGQPLHIVEDRRVKSAGTATPFDVKQAAPSTERAPKNAPPSFDEEGDEIPF